jgi:hypothetical protein
MQINVRSEQSIEIFGPIYHEKLGVTAYCYCSIYLAKYFSQYNERLASHVRSNANEICSKFQIKVNKIYEDFKRRFQFYIAQKRYRKFCILTAIVDQRINEILDQWTIRLDEILPKLSIPRGYDSSPYFGFADCYD